MLREPWPGWPSQMKWNPQHELQKQARVRLLNTAPSDGGLRFVRCHVSSDVASAQKREWCRSKCSSLH